MRSGSQRNGSLAHLIYTVQAINSCMFLLCAEHFRTLKALYKRLTIGEELEVEKALSVSSFNVLPNFCCGFIRLAWFLEALELPRIAEKTIHKMPFKRGKLKRQRFVKGAMRSSLRLGGFEAKGHELLTAE